jgi:hypothetical protein
MARPTALTSLDRAMQLPLTLAGGLRTTFAEVASPAAESAGGARGSIAGRSRRKVRGERK